jgi:DNA-binding CsgD family transcriptional regulator
MIQDEGYRELETIIYEAAVVPELWPAALAKLSAAGNAAGAALVCVNERGVHMTTDPVLAEVGKRFVNEGWMARNSRGNSVIARGLVGLPRFVTEEDYFEPGQELTDPMINELFRPAGFGWAAGFLVQLPHGDIVILNVEQYWDRGPIRGADLARYDSLYPHLARAAMLSGRSDFERVRTAIDTLAAVGLPGVAVTPTGRVVLANDDFAAATATWTTGGSDVLRLHDRVAAAQLTEALDSIHLTQSQRSIPLRSAAGGAITAVLHAIPIRRAAHDIFGSAAAIVVLTEPKRGTADSTLIQAMFDLTPAELSIARALADGQTVAAMAIATGRSIHTVRNQLKTLMEKTGSSRQVELVLMMQQLGRNTPA